MSRYTVLYSQTSDSLKENVEIIVSKVTITVNKENDVQHWLIEELSLTEQGEGIVLQHSTGQQVYISDPVLSQEIKKSYNLYKRTNWGIPVVYISILMKILGFLLIIGILIWFFFRSIVPWMGEKAANSFPKDYEIQLGEQMFAAMKGNLKIDTAKSALLQNFYNELGYNVDYPIKLYWVEENIVNAFAVPGGSIVVYKGIMDKMNGPEELAALLGHEVSHIALKHSLRGIFREAANSIWWMILTGGDAGMIGVVAQQTEQLQGLSYSRELESEADRNGVVLMYNSSINTRGMLELVNILKREEGDSKSYNFLSTHPVAEIRIKQVEELMNEFPSNETIKKDTLSKLFRQLKQSW